MLRFSRLQLVGMSSTRLEEKNEFFFFSRTISSRISLIAPTCCWLPLGTLHVFCRGPQLLRYFHSDWNEKFIESWEKIDVFGSVLKFQCWTQVLSDFSIFLGFRFEENRVAKVWIDCESPHYRVIFSIFFCELFETFQVAPNSHNSMSCVTWWHNEIVELIRIFLSSCCHVRLSFVYLVWHRNGVIRAWTSRIFWLREHVYDWVRDGKIWI